jgi:trimethylamine:corrinoid methyltransferase-like protein
MSSNRLRIEFLTEKDLEHIEETAYRLLDEVGILLDHKEAVEMLSGVGCRIEGERVQMMVNCASTMEAGHPSFTILQMANADQLCFLTLLISLVYWTFSRMLT